MNDEEHRERQMEDVNLAGATSQQAQMNAQTQYYLQEQERGMAESQLECETTLTKLYHQLKQDISIINSQGDIEYLPITDEKKRRLTDDGVHRIIELMSFYVNKENLLSNFNEDQINGIMLRFRLAFSANILMRYKLYFRQPNFEECKQIFLQRISDKKTLRMFAAEMAGVKIDSDKVQKELLFEYEDKMEYELNKIKEEKKKEMLSEFELLFEQLSQLVYASLNRAWKGEERGSIRRHTNISEINSPMRPQQNQDGGLFSRWGRK